MALAVALMIASDVIVDPVVASMFTEAESYVITVSVTRLPVFRTVTSSAADMPAKTPMQNTKPLSGDIRGNLIWKLSD